MSERGSENHVAHHSELRGSLSRRAKYAHNEPALCQCPRMGTRAIFKHAVCVFALRVVNTQKPDILVNLRIAAD